jgi:ArsR family transcriptional regulator
MKTLAHPTRLFIVDELSRGERCVCELTGMVGVKMPTVSRHLSLLKKAGLIAGERRGAQVFYRLKTPCVMNFFQCVAAVRAQERKSSAGTI